MREITHLVDPAAAKRFHWYAPNAILHSNPEIEAKALECEEFWYARKLVWLTTRKQLERKQSPHRSLSRPTSKRRNAIGGCRDCSPREIRRT
jgi:hypothetical protein